MKEHNIDSNNISIKIWLMTSCILAFGVIIVGFFEVGMECVLMALAACFGGIVLSTPVLIILMIFVGKIKRSDSTFRKKIFQLFALCFFSIIPYSILFGSFADYSTNYLSSFFINFGTPTIILFACSAAAILLIHKDISLYFSEGLKQSFFQNHTYMNTNQEPTILNDNNHSNKILIKALITAGLILGMLIPTLFITNLIDERQQRQQEVVTEVSSKWALPQTLTGPYIYVPYTVSSKDDKGQTIVVTKKLFLLPENLNITGMILPEIRPRSIYKVLLYKSDLNAKGNFLIKYPDDIDSNSVQLQHAKICFGVSDFKGIEQKLSINLNGADYELSPGLPNNDIDSVGLSANINLSDLNSGNSLPFSMSVNIKGSGQLHFVPLSGNSTFSLRSSWPNPSFDGNNLPVDRTVDDTGFNAQWAFNKANLPFGTTLEDVNFKKDDYAFGVTMVQPADEYAKTSRSVKYSILIIGLTFSLFFIIELMQKRPFHPVQYVMVGIALIVFFSLLLSISEFVLFNYAYIIASIATVTLITLYAKSHFKTWKIAFAFASILSGLYGFIYVLISLEDTALLIGSIGLFIVLSLIMYASRKINWYKPEAALNDNQMQVV